MHKVTEQDVAYVADLAHLELAPEERARLAQDLGAILAHIDTLNELDTTGVPAMAQVQVGTPALRADEPRASLPRREALGNTPSPGVAGDDPSFFRVPKVIER